MDYTPRSKIVGTGSAYPERVVGNEELAELLRARGVSTSDEWILAHTGISHRRIRAHEDPSEDNSSLGCRAATQALEMAGISADQVDQILYATCTPDTIIPSTACFVQSKLGARRAFAMDINAACSGFVYALATADQFIRSGQVQTSLVIGADALTSFTNWDDRNTCVLFGDAAGAVVVQHCEPGAEAGLISFELGSDGDLWELFHIPAGGSNLEVTPARFEERMNKMHMKGPETFKAAVRTLCELARRSLDRHGLAPSELDWFIPHQANMRIIESVAKRLGFPMERVLTNISSCGNTSSATVPTVLDEAVRRGDIRSGQTILMDVFGAGMTYGSAFLRW